MGEYEKIIHPFEPVFNADSKILILGTMASVKSREMNFYYGHPQNRFWKVLAAVTKFKLPTTIEEKRSLLLANNIAVWDVIASCEMTGSGDHSIRNVVPNDFLKLLANSKIAKIYTNGKKADALYKDLCEGDTKIKSICLPSTSPANAVWKLEKLTESWRSSLDLSNQSCEVDHYGR